MFIVNFFEPIRKPSKQDQKLAIESYSALATMLEHLNAEHTEIEIEETSEKIKVPLSALKLLSEILKTMAEGKMVSIIPVATELTTQAAAEMLGCSRPYLVKLLEEGKIAFTKVGKHRRIKFDDVMSYRKQMKEQQKKHIIEIMNDDEETGLYDS
jgi:excisionase family DNA binding protein